MNFHRLSKYFPLLEGEEFELFKQDIEKNGQLEPIVLFKGEILDGANRYRACLALGVEPRFEEYKGSDPLGYVVSTNIRRRHLDVSQRSMIATEMLPEFEAEAEQQRREKISHFQQTGETRIDRAVSDHPARDQAARVFGVSGVSVQSSKRRRRNASHSLLKNNEERMGYSVPHRQMGNGTMVKPLPKPPVFSASVAPGWTNEVIGSKFGWTKQTVGQYLSMLEYSMVDHTLGYEHVNEAKAGTGGDKKLVEQVLEAAAETELSTRETRSLAEKVKAANEFDGEKGVKATIQQFKKNHKELGKAWLKEHDQPIIGKVKGKLLFEWLKDPRVLQAEEGVRAISAAVAAIAQSNEDPAGGLHVLHSLQEKVDILLEQIGDVLEDME